LPSLPGETPEADLLAGATARASTGCMGQPKSQAASGSAVSSASGTCI
jgi:hypothetical protein